MGLITFILICYGISNIIIYGSIFKPFRELMDWISEPYLGKLFNCMICLPTWVGFTISYFFYSPSLDYISHQITIDSLEYSRYVSIFLDGMIASGSVWLVHTLQEHLEG